MLLVVVFARAKKEGENLPQILPPTYLCNSSSVD